MLFWADGRELWPQICTISCLFKGGQQNNINSEAPQVLRTSWDPAHGTQEEDRRQREALLGSNTLWKKKTALLHSENANTVLSVLLGLNGHSGPTRRNFCSVLVHQSMDRVMVTPASPWHLATWELLAYISDVHLGHERLFPPSLKTLPFLKRVS